MMWNPVSSDSTSNWMRLMNTQRYALVSHILNDNNHKTYNPHSICSYNHLENFFKKYQINQKLDRKHWFESLVYSGHSSYCYLLKMLLTLNNRKSNYIMIKIRFWFFVFNLICKKLEVDSPRLVLQLTLTILVRTNILLYHQCTILSRVAFYTASWWGMFRMDGCQCQGFPPIS